MTDQTLEPVVAFAMSALLAFQYRLPPDIPIGFLPAFALLPMTVRMITRYQGILWVCVWAPFAAASGALLTFLADPDFTSRSLVLVEAVRVLGLAAGALALLWSRHVIGTAPTVAAYALGGLASLGLTGVSTLNPWKFSLSVPITLLVLALPVVRATPRRQGFALVGLAAVSALNDSRSAAAILLIGAAIQFLQGLRRRGRRTSRAKAFATVAILGLGGFYLIQAAALEGMLGDQAQVRTSEQIRTGGSVIAGGRPELGASVALIAARPLGYGSGVLASPTDVSVAKHGMDGLGYDPNNGYVERYMFGRGLEVHSFLGDLWLLHGIAGAVLACAVLVAVVMGILASYARGALTGVALFLGLRTIWDFAFSPLAAVMLTVMLAIAVAVPERPVQARKRALQTR